MYTPSTSLLIVYVILITISATATNPALNIPYQPHDTRRRLLSTESNFSTTLTQSPLIESSMFYQNTEFESPPQQSVQLLDNLRDDHIYQSIAILIISHTTVVCCLIFFCRKQSVSHQQIKDLTLKIDGLIANNQYQRTLSQSVASPTSPPTVSLNAMTVSSVSNHPPLTTINETNHDHMRRYAHVQIRRSLTEPQKTITVSQSTNTNERVTALNNRPWSPKRVNNTCLPPCMYTSGFNTIKRPQTVIRLPNEVYNITMDRNVTASMTPSKSISVSDIREDMQDNDHYMDACDSIWSEANTVINVLEHGQSGLSRNSTIDIDRDSVLQEILGLNVNMNVNKRQRSKDPDVETILEVDEDVIQDTTLSEDGLYHDQF